MDMCAQRDAGALKALRLNKLRWWLPQGFELPRVDKRLNCSSPTFLHRDPDAKFNHHLRDLFLVVLIWGVTNIMLYLSIGLQTVETGIFFIEVSAAVVFVSVMVKTMMETMRSAAAKTDEVRSVSPPPPPSPPPLVQHV